ncbi:acyl-CoA dehydrogenase family protein [bacterium]|nr:acyl-CoA dehydrogenase family protein [bacterium]
MSPDPTHSTADESRDLAEDSRETEWTAPSFGAELFMGNFRPELVFPFPEQDPEDRAEGDAFCAKLEKYLREHVDAEKIDRDEEVPESVIRGLVDLGVFSMKIPKKYGGLELSQLNYNRAVALIASHCASTAVWVSAHQSIGVPTPLKMFGTEEQKSKYLPRLAGGEISGFALTEGGVGSDPANMGTTAVLSEDGTEWILNGEKLWCTNGLYADILIVMARTPPRMVNGKERKRISAFIVEMKNTPGVTYPHRCRFLGIRAISNGVIRFENVRIPKENLLGGEGRGLKIALVTLNTGRLTLPAAAGGAAKQCLQIARRWSGIRTQWGRPIGQHEAGAAKLSWIASHTFAMEAVSDLAGGLSVRGGVDIRMEAAMAKLFGSEASERIADLTLQIRGGRGFEQEGSLRDRGEIPFPVERIYRDARINTIVEGTSDVMHLFIAREALDPHLSKAGALVDPRSTTNAKMKSLGTAMTFYPGWYATRWFSGSPSLPADVPPELTRHLKYVHRTSRRLARSLFHAMVTVGPALERRQELLARFVDIGVDLFAMSAAVSRSTSLVKRDGRDRSSVPLADHFCRVARRRIAQAFHGTKSNDDRSAVRVTKALLDKQFSWLEAGIVTSCPEEGGAGAADPSRKASAAPEPAAKP